MQDWDLNVQRSFGSDLLFEIGYVGTKGTKLPRFIEGNPAIYIPGVDADGDPISTSDNADRRRKFSGCTLDPATVCNFSSTGLITGIANSSYNALEASLRKRFSHGISFLASYTYSKSIDDSSTFNLSGSASKPLAGENDLAQNPFDVNAERGRSLFDSRHRFVLSYQWSLPLWRQPKGWYQQVLGNWQVNGIVTAMTGTPFTVFDGNDFSVQGSAPEITGFFSNRPNVVADKSQRRSENLQRMAQPKCIPANHPGSQLSGAAIRHGGPQHRPGSGIRGLGLLVVQEHPRGGIEGGSVPGGVLQYPEPYELPYSRQRHELANFQPDSGGPAPAADPVRVEVQFLRLAGKRAGAKTCDIVIGELP